MVRLHHRNTSERPSDAGVCAFQLMLSLLIFSPTSSHQHRPREERQGNSTSPPPPPPPNHRHPITDWVIVLGLQGNGFKKQAPHNTESATRVTNIVKLTWSRAGLFQITPSFCCSWSLQTTRRGRSARLDVWLNPDGNFFECYWLFCNLDSLFSSIISPHIAHIHTGSIDT